MAITSNNVQNVKFLRNGTLFGTRELAKNALTGFTLTDEQDGTAILARYSTNGVPAVKTLVGFVYKNSDTASVTVFDVDDAGTDAKAYVDSLVGTGVTTANTVTQQLQVLSGDSSTAQSGDTSVEGAKKYTDGKIEALDLNTVAVEGKPIIAVEQEDGLVSASAGTIDAEFVDYTRNTGVTNVQDALDDIYSVVDHLDTPDQAVAGEYVSAVSQLDGKITVSRAAFPDATTDTGESKVVIDVTQTKGQVATTAANLTGVKLDGYVADTGATGDIASTDTLGQALAKLQTQVNATESTIESLDYTDTAVTGSYVSKVDEANGVISVTREALPTVAAISEAGKPITAVSESLGVVSATAGTINAEYVNVTGSTFSSSTVQAALEEIETEYKAADAAIVDNASESANTLAKLEDIVNEITADAATYTIRKDTTGLPAEIKERYTLVETKDGQSTDKQVAIDIPKDSHIVSINYITTGEHAQNLEYVYVDVSGNTQQTYVDMSELVLEAEFASGVTVTDHVAHGVVDPTSEAFLTVGAGGFKLAGVQNAIDTAISGLDFTTDAAVAGQYVAAIEETDGVVAVKTRANVSEAVLNNYAKGSDAAAVAATDTVNQAISKLENQVDAAKAAATTVVTEGTDAGNNMSIVETADADGHKIFTVNLSDVASAQGLADEITARTNADTELSNRLGTGVTTANTATAQLAALSGNSATAQSGDTSVEGAKKYADAKLADVVGGLDAEVSGETADGKVNVKVTEVDGVITAVGVVGTDIASDSALTAEIAARKAVDGQNGDTYAANSSANYISDATSLNDADVRLDTQVKANADAIAGNKVVAGNGIEVGTPASTGTSVSVKIDNTTYPGGSALAADTNGLRITSIDCGTY